MSSPRGLVLGLCAAALLSNAGQALAQYYSWPEESYGRPGAYDPWDDDRREERRPRARARSEDGRDRRAAQPATRDRTHFASLPADADPNYSTPVDYDYDIDLQSRRRFVADPTGETPGTLTINTRARRLYLSLDDGRAMEYAIGVGRTGFAWKGEAQIGRKAFWPGWTPPPEMLERRPDLPEHMDGGLENPLGARALYLFQGNKDTLFRIHGTNEPESIGRAVSSGCIRMLNADVIDLYDRVSKGARVVVR